MNNRGVFNRVLRRILEYGYVVLVGQLLFLSSCSLDMTGDGSGTGTGNPVIVGTVYYPDGQPAKGLLAVLRSQDYYTDIQDIGAQELDSSGVSLTDDRGTFRFDSVMPGEYFIEVRTINEKRSVLLSCTVSVHTSKIVLPADTLRSSKQITGTVGLYGGDSSTAYIQIYGLERLIVVHTDGTFSIVVPDGLYRLRCVTDSKDYSLVIADNVKPGVAGISLKVLADEPYSTNYACDTLIIRAILDSNGLHTLSATAVSYISNDRVYQVDMEGTRFFTIPTLISGLSALEELEIQFCRVSSLPAKIGFMPALIELELDSCQLSTLPEAFVNLNNLRELDLCGNRLLGHLSTALETWADTFDPDWRESQIPDK